MNKKSCRLCYQQLFDSSLLCLTGMPKAAQHFLSFDELPSNESITLDIYQCSNCGLVQLNIEPVSYYKNVITAASISGDARKSRLSQMLKFANKFNLKNKKIIEIGCAKGDMLDIIEEAKMKAYGLEHSSDSVLIAKNKGRKIIKGFIDDLKIIEHAPFQGFVCFNYLEHVPNPKSVINKIYNNLSDDGVGLVTVPNLNYLLDTKSFYEFVADHLSYFTMDTLKNAFYEGNFDVLECSLINNENDIFIIIKKNKNKNNKIKKKISFKKINLKNNYKEVDKLINNLKNIIKDYKEKNKKVAIWGAGHRTLSLLALSKLKDIEFIVDSAKFKQGMYSPVMNTKIVSPEVLKESKIDLLIIMVPGIYPHEVIKSVSKMNLNIRMAKLKDNVIEFI
jgi:2-polyprenyl-3-methyl-5-hydroxy-6-metoxy-1,4-benzoquinol methylase